MIVRDVRLGRWGGVRAQLCGACAHGSTLQRTHNGVQPATAALRDSGLPLCPSKLLRPVLFDEQGDSTDCRPKCAVQYL